MAHPSKLKAHPGKAHKPELDDLSPAMIRVVCEQLLYTMQTDQRHQFMATLPGLYVLIYPGHADAAGKIFLEAEASETPT